MDEATSALDYETERKVCDNLSPASKTSRSFITHRLSTIRQADMIVMLHEGAVVVRTHEKSVAARSLLCPLSPAGEFLMKMNLQIWRELSSRAQING